MIDGDYTLVWRMAPMLDKILFGIMMGFAVGFFYYLFFEEKDENNPYV